MRALGKRLADSEARVSAYGHRDAVILAGGWQDEVVQAVSGLLLAAAGALGAGEIAREMLPAGVNSELAAMAVFIVALLLMISLKSAQTKRFRALEHITSAAEDTRVEELQSSDTPNDHDGRGDSLCSRSGPGPFAIRRQSLLVRSLIGARNVVPNHESISAAGGA